MSTAQPLMLDCTRMVARYLSGAMPTGIDRVADAYRKHFASRAQAVIQVRGRAQVISWAQSERLFAQLDTPGSALGQRFAALARGITAVVEGEGRGVSASAGALYLNVRKAEGADYANTQVALIDLDPVAYKRVTAFEQSLGLAQRLGEGGAGEVLIGPGDVLEIAMWEAPPAVLFGGGGVIPGLDAGAQNRTVVQQVVDGSGKISVPFAGAIEAGGRTPAEIERSIVVRLAGRANDPQVSVRLSLNDSRNVTVLGEVASSRRVPLRRPAGPILIQKIVEPGRGADSFAVGCRIAADLRVGDDAPRDHLGLMAG
jgi:Polysaccharide biosynthesis/export protein